MDLRKIFLSLFLFAMPWTVIDSGLGFFADADDWQGYDVAVVRPLFIFLLGAWLTNAPRFIHVIGAGSCCIVAVLLPLATLRELRFPFVFLEAAWIFAAFAPLIRRLKGNPVNPPAPTQDATSESN